MLHALGTSFSFSPYLIAHPCSWTSSLLFFSNSITNRLLPTNYQMATQQSLSASELFADDAAAHKYIQLRAKQLIDFLQIDDEAFFKKIPHLQLAEPYKCVFSTFQRQA